MECLKDCNAECCGIVPIDRKVLRRYKKKMQRVPQETIPAGSEVICITEDGLCVFLDSSCKCAIYDLRPRICRLYGTVEDLPCPYIDIHGNIRSKEQVEIMKGKINAYVDTQLARLSVRILPGK